MTGDSLFTNILAFPTGFDEPFDLTSPGCTIPGTFTSGDSLNFVSLCGKGVSEFAITGIDPPFDPTNSSAFPIELTFDTPTADFVAAPLDSSPEPATTFLTMRSEAQWLGHGVAKSGSRRTDEQRASNQGRLAPQRSSCQRSGKASSTGCRT